MIDRLGKGGYDKKEFGLGNKENRKNENVGIMLPCEVNITSSNVTIALIFWRSRIFKFCRTSSEQPLPRVKTSFINVQPSTSTVQTCAVRAKKRYAHAECQTEEPAVDEQDLEIEDVEGPDVTPIDEGKSNARKYRKLLMLSLCSFKDHTSLLYKFEAFFVAHAIAKAKHST